MSDKKSKEEQAQEQVRNYSFQEVFGALSLGKGPGFIDRLRMGKLTEKEKAEIEWRGKVEWKQKIERRQKEIEDGSN